ncbi:hypothetical protein NE237_025525 [Protea cynaroides]|uniref:F-box associated beta-propeller type 3 domain-containing protein n=1 Tax=Protea cynaroides TaxID=273540 RepID=A0A9Q0JZL2_9MAGN|nr:hypothetical protein NE237_025525 [Protea cynaroides]
MVNGEGEWKTREIPMVCHLKSSDFRNREIIVSCNGFLCITPIQGCGPVCLLNPITRERMMLPKSQLTLSPTLLIPGYCVGFGFDLLSNKYKVVRVYYENHQAYSDGEVRGFSEIITVGETTWRKLDSPEEFRKTRLLYGSYSNPVFLDGTLYWLTNNYSWLCSGKKVDILALDMDSEKFWSIEDCPSPRQFRNRRSLIIVDGSLAIIDYHSYYDYNPDSLCSMEIWLLKGSKTMGFSFNSTTYDMSGLLHPQNKWEDFFVIAKLDHDTFLLRMDLLEKNEYSIVLYSPERKQYSSVHESSNKIFQHCWMMPTLRSLKAAIDK